MGFVKPMSWLGLALVFAGGLNGCDWAPLRGDGETQGYWLPLNIGLRFDPSVTAATLTYTDACQQPRTISIGEQLSYVLRREIGMAFNHVRMEADPPKRPVDGQLDVSLGIKEVSISIPRQADKVFPMTISLGGTIDFRDAEGKVIYSKSIRTDVPGDVETAKKSCEVKGLPELANAASLTLAQGFKVNLGTSVKLKEYARQREEQKR